MADIKFDYGDLDRLITGLTETPARVERDAPDIVQRAGTRYQSRAKFFAPVDTGRMKSEILIDPGGVLDVTVTSHAPYSGWVEFGNSRQNPQPFLRPAEESVTPEVVDEFRDLGAHLA